MFQVINNSACRLEPLRGRLTLAVKLFLVLLKIVYRKVTCLSQVTRNFHISHSEPEKNHRLELELEKEDPN